MGAAAEPRSLALLTDLYQLTMACGYWKRGMMDHEATFHLFFRRNPFGGGYTIAAGLGEALKVLAAMRFTEDDLAFLAAQKGNDGKALFEAGFLDFLRGWRFDCAVDAVPEGTVVFPLEPLLRVSGPVISAQLVETILLNIINFSSLIATKAARVCHAAQGGTVLEFGLRRAQGMDGALTASRSAYIGGCDATSNVLAGKLYGIPVRGTHAHSWVMCFDSELEAFDAYLEALPNNSTLLVDTYDTLEGVRNAVRAGLKLRARGYDLGGIRLDSGDLAWLSQQARQILDEAGFKATRIVASNDLDERTIESLRHQGSRIDVYGVGTCLVTGNEQPALGGVYKLAAIREPGGQWMDRIKLSEQAVKTSIPGMLQVRRFSTADGFACDAIYDERHGWPGTEVIVDPTDPARRKSIPEGATTEDLLIRVYTEGRIVAGVEPLDIVRDRVKRQMAGLHSAVRRFEMPHLYPAGLEIGLHERRVQMCLARHPAAAPKDDHR